MGRIFSSRRALVSARLAPDMHPLRDQVRFVCYQARDGIRRLTDRQVPEPETEPVTLSELEADIAATLALVDDVSEAELRAYCEQQLAAYKRPRRYRLLAAEALPLTSTGKVMKLAMPALFGADETAAS